MVKSALDINRRKIVGLMGNYSPQSSSSSGASSSLMGLFSTTSSSAPQSAQLTISPFSTSFRIISASHSGQ